MKTIIVLAIIALILYGAIAEENVDFDSQDPAPLIREKFKKVLERHEKRISKIANDGVKLRHERESFDDRLSFSRKLWEWMEEVKHYPHWFKNSKNDDGTPYWKSASISPEKLLVTPFRNSALKQLSADCSKFDDTSEVLEYSFESNNKKYKLFIGAEGKAADTWEKTDKLLISHPAYIFEDNSKLVYQANLLDEYIINEVAGLHSWERRELVAFKPSLWTGELLELFHIAKQEAEKSYKAFLEKSNQTISKRDLSNFSE